MSIIGGLVDNIEVLIHDDKVDSSSSISCREDFNTVNNDTGGVSSSETL
jgi:hypothetical protein